MEFQPWPKIARLNRDIVVTEKIDGTNAAVLIERVATHSERTVMPGPLLTEGTEAEQAAWLKTHPFGRNTFIDVVEWDGAWFTVQAQSRKRLILPGSDNFVFAAWVAAHAIDLVVDLGEGRHFGEWWGSGIQRGYDQPKGVKNFSLFNTARYAGVWHRFDDGSTLTTVPKIAHFHSLGTFDVEWMTEWLRDNGSVAAPGFERPEGYVIYHAASNQMFKVTLEGDEAPKGPEGHKGDEG